MFEKASRMKLRFNTPVGALPVEDIWDLPLRQTMNRNKGANLNDIAKVLHQELKNDNELDFVDDVEKPNKELVLKFEIVKHIIAVRKEELKARENAQLARQKKARILEIIAGKEDEALKGKSLEDLRSMLDSL